MAAVTDIADAIVAQLEDGSFVVDFTICRAYRPEYSLTQLKTVQVTVVPKTMEWTAATKIRDNRQYTVDIAIQQKLANEEAGTVDPLMLLAEQFCTVLFRHRLDAMESALCVEIANEPIYSLEHLEEHAVFTSLLTATYRLMG